MNVTIDEILAAMSALVDGAAGRTLTNEEITRYEALEGELTTARADAAVRGRQQAYLTPVPSNMHTADAPGTPAPRTNPLAYSPAALEKLQNALRERQSTSVRADLDRFENVTVGTGDLGSRRVWGSNVLSGPRILHVVAGVPTQPADAIFAQFPQLTLPTASAASAEGATLLEYDTSDAGSVTLGRFGRFTDLSEESLIGADSGAIIGMHNLGIALDLDAVLINAVETDAGAAETFDADVPAAARRAIARVVDATAAASLDGLVILANPDDIHLLEDVAPIGGNTIGEGFALFSGVLAYASSAVNAGFMTVANLRTAIRYFEAMPVRTATDTDVKTGVLTAATAVISGYARGLANGYASMIDVVTP